MKSVFLRACALGSLLSLAVLPHAAHAQAVKRVFSYTGANQSFLVPEGVFTLTVKLWGAGGGVAGGSGAFVTGNLAVTPGATLTLIVGGGGFGGFGGFGGGGQSGFSSRGGGRSGIRNASNVELVTAAGGGGGDGGAGGGGGLNVGGAGANVGGDGGPGGGGTQTAGGAGGANDGFGGGQSGGAFQGGGGSPSGGGGGGGGYFGGGGGSGISGGGGGSSYFVNPAFAFNSALSQAGSQGSSAGVAPGGAGDIDYLTGIGRGGANNAPGGNGLIVFSYIAVPEPGSLALLALGAGAFLIARRRRDT